MNGNVKNNILMSGPTLRCYFSDYRSYCMKWVVYSYRSYCMKCTEVHLMNMKLACNQGLRKLFC